jgi:hypothetical protein
MLTPDECKKLIRVIISYCILFTLVILISLSLAHGAGVVPQDSVISNKEIIMYMLGLLQTIFAAIGLWLIANDRELFTRVGKIETKQAVRDQLCDERNDQGTHPHLHQRDSDKNPDLALKELLSLVRTRLYESESKKENI